MLFFKNAFFVIFFSLKKLEKRKWETNGIWHFVNSAEMLEAVCEVFYLHKTSWGSSAIGDYERQTVILNYFTNNNSELFLRIRPKPRSMEFTSAPTICCNSCKSDWNIQLSPWRHSLISIHYLSILIQYIRNKLWIIMDFQIPIRKIKFQIL